MSREEMLELYPDSDLVYNQEVIDEYLKKLLNGMLSTRDLLILIGIDKVTKYLSRYGFKITSVDHYICKAIPWNIQLN